MKQVGKDWFCLNVDLTDHKEVLSDEEMVLYSQLLCWKSELFVFVRLS
jgi:hypothetical protein